MVVRSSTRNASRMASLSLSRATVREVNSKPFWNEVKQLDVFPGETASDVEFIENYGSTMVPAKQDKDEEEQQQQGQGQQGGGGDGSGPGGLGEDGEQPKGDAPEAIVGYMNGSRSHPVVLGMGDRRHRLLELEEGDVAQHRLKDDRQQMLYSKDGTYISTRSDKLMRIALVPKQDEQQQTPSQQQQANGARGGGATSGGGKEKKQKTMGQKSAKDDNKKSQVSIEQNGQVTTSQHGDAYAAQKGGSDSSTYWKDRKKSTQVTEEHAHIRFQDNRIYNDKDGNWCTSPLLVKKDAYCKE